MEQVKHTPGPWFSGSGNMPFNRIIKSQAGDLIAKAGDVCVGDVEANARLIAAAPDLLEALHEQDCFLGVLAGTVPLSEKDTHRRIQINREAVRAAIAKATGA